jgi:protein ImuB
MAEWANQGALAPADDFRYLFGMPAGLSPAPDPTPWRIACVRIPRFPLGAVWRQAAAPSAQPVQLTLALSMAAVAEAAPKATNAPHWDDVPRALADGQRLKTVSVAAARAGVTAGMRLPEARARCSTLDVRPWDADSIGRAITETTASFLAASPQVTPAAGAAGTWWVGANGLAHRGPQAEAALLDTLLTIARRWHPQARVALADSCVAARAATWNPARGAPATIIPAGGCASYLAAAPLGLIPMDADLRSALHALGIKTLGAFAAFDSGDVEARWGATGLASWRLARGIDPRRPGLVRVDAPRAVHAELPTPAQTVTPVGFLVRAALERLVADLVRDGRSAASVAITLELDVARHNTEAHMEMLIDSRVGHDARRLDGWDRNARTITREARPARPLARVEPLVELCRSLLERWTLPAAVTGVSVHIPATAPLSADQGDLLEPSWRDAAASVEAALARLSAALDPEGRGDVVVHPEAADAHRYDRAGTWVRADAWVLAERATRADAVRESRPAHAARDGSARDHATIDQLPLDHAALRLLETPDAVTVHCTNGVPSVVEWQQRRVTVSQASGPERLAGDWWRADAFARDYWRCVAEGEGDLLLYQEQGAWFVQGWFD